MQRERGNRLELGMSETPVPEVQVEAAGEPAFAAEVPTQADDGDLHAAAEQRAPKNGRLSGRPVSAFGSSSLLMRHPAERPDERPDERSQGQQDGEPSAQPDEAGFVAGLQAAGLLREFSLSELDRIQSSLRSEPGAARRLDLLDAYYAAGGDAVAALRRRATDRWFVFHATDNIGAPQLIQRLLGVIPELSGAHLERVGSSSGTLVLRLDDHLCALDDEQTGLSRASVGVPEVVRALNVLLDRKNVRARLVGLLGDGSREAYVGLGSLMNALPLAEADYLTAEDAEALMGLTAW